MLANARHVGRNCSESLLCGVGALRVIGRRLQNRSGFRLSNAQVLLRAIYHQGALQSFSDELERLTTQRLSRARLQQLPLDGEGTRWLIPHLLNCNVGAFYLSPRQIVDSYGTS